MRKKRFKEKRGMKKAAAKKVAKKAKVNAKAKKAPSKKKKAERVKAKIKKKTTTKKTSKEEMKKVKAKIKKKKAVKKATKETKVGREEKAEKKVTKKKEKKVPLKVEKKVEVKKVTEKPKKRIKAKEVALPKKAVLRRPKKVLRTEKEEKYPPFPIEILPEEYGEDSIALMTVDPRKLFIYWEVREDTLKKYAGNLNIRLYDVTDVDFDDMNANSYFDMAVNNRIGSSYIDVNPEREFIADIGVIDTASVFITVARSNKVSTPRAKVAEEDVLPLKLYETGLPKGLPKGLPIGYEK